MKATLDNSDCASKSAVADCRGADEVLDLVRQLDGKQHTELRLLHSDGWELIIGGGPDRYVVAKFDGHEGAFTAINASHRGGPPFELCVGGQSGEYPAELVFLYAEIRGIVRGFFDAPSNTKGAWRRDQPSV